MTVKTHTQSNPKKKSPVTGNRGAWREGDKIVASEDFQATRAKEPIFGPAVPQGEEYEFQVKEYHCIEDVLQGHASTQYDVLNGFMPQAKGEFMLRSLGGVLKALVARSEANSNSSANSAVGALLEKDSIPADSPELAEFKQLLEKQEKK